MENEGEVRTDMAEAIHAGYTAEDPAAREGFRKMFDNEEPSIEAFIARITLQAPASGRGHRGSEGSGSEVWKAEEGPRAGIFGGLAPLAAEGDQRGRSGTPPRSVARNLLEVGNGILAAVIILTWPPRGWNGFTSNANGVKG